MAELPSGLVDESRTAFGEEMPYTLSGTVGISSAVPGRVEGVSLHFVDEDSVVGGTLQITGPQEAIDFGLDGNYTILSFVAPVSGGQNAVLVAKEGFTSPTPWPIISDEIEAILNPVGSASLCSNLFTDVFDFISSKDSIINPLSGIAANLSQTGASAVAGMSEVLKGAGTGVTSILDSSTEIGGEIVGQIGEFSGTLVGSVENLLDGQSSNMLGKVEEGVGQGVDLAVKGYDTVAGFISSLSLSSPFSMKPLTALRKSLIPDISFKDIEFPGLCSKPPGTPVQGAQFDTDGKRDVDRQFESGIGANHSPGQSKIKDTVFGKVSGSIANPLDVVMGASTCGPTAAKEQTSTSAPEIEREMGAARNFALNNESADVRETYTQNWKDLTLRIPERQLIANQHWRAWVYDPDSQTFTGNQAAGIAAWSAAGGGSVT